VTHWSSVTFRVGMCLRGVYIYRFFPVFRAVMVQALVIFAVVLYGLTTSVGMAMGDSTAATPGMVDLAQMCGLDRKSQCTGLAGALSTIFYHAENSHPDFLNDGNTNTFLYAVDGPFKEDLSKAYKSANIEIDLGAPRSIQEVVIYAGKFDLNLQYAEILVLHKAGCIAESETFRTRVHGANKVQSNSVTTYTTECVTIGQYVCIQRCKVASSSSSQDKTLSHCRNQEKAIGIGELQVLSFDAEMCPAYSHAPAGSRNIDDCVCAAGYEGANGEECTECVSGKYMPTGTSTCIACTQTSGCQCKAGWYGQLGLNCTECPPHATSLPNSVDATSCFFVSTLATQACVDAEWNTSDTCTSSADPPNEHDPVQQPRRIIDGDILTDLSVKSNDGWVTIDLLRNRMITGVRIVSIGLSRVGDDVLVKVGTEDSCTGSVCVEHAVLGTMQSTIMSCEAWGRYVCVKNGNYNNAFELAELQVWAHPVNTTCPDNSRTQAGGDAASFWDLQKCVCDDGYAHIPGGAWCTLVYTTTCPDHSRPQGGDAASVGDQQKCVCDDGYVHIPGWAHVLIHGSAWCTLCNPSVTGCPSCAQMHETAWRTHTDCLVVYMQQELFKTVQAGISVRAILVALSDEVRALLSPEFSLRIESQPRCVNDVVLRRGAGTASWYPANINPTHSSTNTYRLVMPAAV